MALDPVTAFVVDKVASLAVERVVKRVLPESQELRNALTDIRDEQERQSLVPLQTGLRHLERDEFDDARRHLVQSLGQEDDGALTHLLLAGTYLRLGRPDDAARDLALAVLLNPFLLTFRDWSELAPALRTAPASVVPRPAPARTAGRVRGSLALPALPGHAPTWSYLLHAVRFHGSGKPVLDDEPDGWRQRAVQRLTGWGGHGFVYAMAVADWVTLERSWVVFWWVSRTEGVHTVSPMESVVWAVDSASGDLQWQERLGPHDRLALVTPGRVVIERPRDPERFLLLDTATGRRCTTMRERTFRATFCPTWPTHTWGQGFTLSHWQHEQSLYDMWQAGAARGIGVDARVVGPLTPEPTEVSLLSVFQATTSGSNRSPVLRGTTLLGRLVTTEHP